MSMAAIRRLLCFAPSGKQPELESALRGTGWNVDVVTDATALAHLVQGGDYRVGLAIFTDTDQIAPFKQLGQMLPTDGALQWVALASTQTLQNKFCRELISSRCHDYHTLPLDPERLVSILGRADGMAALASVSSLESGQEEGWAAYNLVGSSSTIRSVFLQASKFAGTQAPVLIRGESGTGKERFAEVIHRLSARADGPFVPVNCAVLSSTLAQSELFGHERGAYTGAHQRKRGRLEVAQGGTVLLDEIGDLPADVQANLLRFLEEKTIQRVGGTEHIPIDVRVIAATHVDLEDAVQRGEFRADLFYRLDVLTLTVPPLRQRRADIELIARHVFRNVCAEEGSRAQGFTAEALLALRQHEWPGNVRELVNRVRKAVVLCSGRLITRQELGFERRSGAKSRSVTMTLSEAREEAERQSILSSLDCSDGNVAEAARQLKVSRSYLYELMTKHKIAWRQKA